MAAGTLAGMIGDWINRRRAQATGAASQGPDEGAARVETVGPSPDAAPDAAAPTPDLPTKPYPTPQNLLERQYNQLWEIEQQLAKAKLDAQSGDDAVRIPAEKIIPTLTTQQTSLLSQIGQQENREADNRRADEAKAQAEADRKQREADAKAERERVAAQQPKEGDTRTSRVEHNGVTAIITETYSRGQWSYVPGSAKADTGLLGQRSEADALDLQRKQLDYDRARLAYENESDPIAKEQRRLALEQARQNLNRPTDLQSEGYLVRVRPDGTTERIDTLTPEQRRQRDEQTALTLETARRGTLPQNARAALEQEAARLQARGNQELARLRALQEQGALSAEQASRQFDDWYEQYVRAPLLGLRAQAEEAQRLERQKLDEANLQEERRVQAANQQREQLAQSYGEQARTQLISTFPGARSPEFAQAYGGNVAAMSQRAGLATAEERMKAPRGQGYTPQALSAGAIQAVMPSPDQIAADARNRALAAIAPAVALRQGYTAPTLPSLPDINAVLGSIPYTGPLSAAPTYAGALPTPNMGAVDLGTGQARTYYGPTGRTWLDWDIR